MYPFLTRTIRRAFTTGLALLAATNMANAGTYNLSFGEKTVNLTGNERTGMAINGTIPGPVLRFKEGEDLTINVTNTMGVDTGLVPVKWRVPSVKV